MLRNLRRPASSLISPLIHGNTTHCGKNSRFGTKKAEKSAEMTKKDKIKALKKELDKAVSEQNFEHAAELRDQIKEMEA